MTFKQFKKSRKTLTDKSAIAEFFKDTTVDPIDAAARVDAIHVFDESYYIKEYDGRFHLEIDNWCQSDVSIDGLAYSLYVWAYVDGVLTFDQFKESERIITDKSEIREFFKDVPDHGNGYEEHVDAVYVFYLGYYVQKYNGNFHLLVGDCSQSDSTMDDLLKNLYETYLYNL